MIDGVIPKPVCEAPRSPEEHESGRERGPATAEDTIAVYIHLPFCRVKCTYCAFAISTDLRFEERYVSALIEEMRRRLPPDSHIGSLYFGGGTPSRLSPRGVERLGAELSRYRRDERVEVTLEANPEDVDENSVGLWRDELGVNRISLGVQSFHDRELEPLGRQHGHDGALAALELASALIPRVSVDLILGLPGQTVESVASSTESALASPIGHLSLYILDLEPGSALEGRVATGLVRIPEDETTAAMYREVVRRAERAGLYQYEVSNFARPGQEAVHNRRYWRRERYFGLGLGAHSFDGRRRHSNTRSIRDYLAAIEEGRDATDFSEILTDEEIRHERLFLGMRQTDGLTLEEFLSLAGDAADAWLRKCRVRGLIAEDGKRVRFTVDGFLLSDELISDLF